MNIAVIGTGYVGLVTGVCLAFVGHSVTCADISADKIATLRQGKLPVWEQGLEELFQDSVRNNRIKFSDDIKKTIIDSSIIMLAVGTPSLADGEVDLTQVWSVADQFRSMQPDGKERLIIVKSTVPVGTCEAIQARIKSFYSGEIDIVHNPEFLSQGQAVQNFLHPDRIVVGYSSESSLEIMKHIYRPIEAPILFVGIRSAELMKYAANAFLAMKISYINMIAGLSEKVGADIEEIAQGIGSDRRIGNHFLQAGIGYGGSCFPKDLRALLRLGKQHDYDLPLIEATETVNRRQPVLIMDKLLAHFGSVKNMNIALIGLSFKPMTDDIREAPSLTLSRLLHAEMATIYAYDPIIQSYPILQVQLCEHLDEAIAPAHAVIILTEWETFKTIDTKIFAGKLVIDARNVFDLTKMKQDSEQYAFSYISIGR